MLSRDRVAFVARDQKKTSNTYSLPLGCSVGPDILPVFGKDDGEEHVEPDGTLGRSSLRIHFLVPSRPHLFTTHFDRPNIVGMTPNHYFVLPRSSTPLIPPAKGRLAAETRFERHTEGIHLHRQLASQFGDNNYERHLAMVLGTDLRDDSSSLS